MVTEEAAGVTVDELINTVRHGLVMILDGTNPPQPARIHLTEDELLVQKEELVYATSEHDKIDPTLLTKERTVTIFREKVGGLGLSVKGGAEHNLPVLISRIFKEQAADKTGQLFVGDAILKVNNQVIDSSNHDDAVQALKNAGEVVTLTVKYFRPASLFLNRNKRTERDEENNHQDIIDESQLERQWTTIAMVPLLCAYVTSFIEGTDKRRDDHSFEVVASNRQTRSGVIQCDDAQSMSDWLQCISHNINLINSQSMVLSNKLLVPSQQVVHMCWVWERTTGMKSWEAWQPVFIALKGAEICIFDTPPVKTRDWNRCEYLDKIYECMLRVVKETELLDDRRHCFTVQTGNGVTRYLNVESRQDLLRMEKAWYRANYLSVKFLGNKTFGCTFRGLVSGLTLDLNVGFSLYDSNSKSYMWSYRFSQLKGSSDDGRTKLKLHFLNDQTQQIETRELECTNLQTLLFSMHAFLSAKLASVDPTFLTSH